MFARKRIKLDPDLYEKARKVAEERGYASVEEFVAHVVERAVAAQGDANADKDVRDRLSGLGYIS